MEIFIKNTRFWLLTGNYEIVMIGMVVQKLIKGESYKGNIYNHGDYLVMREKVERI